MNRDFKGIWIPKEVYLDKRLNALEKIILVEIDSLDNGENGCYASNEYLAEFCQCSQAKVSTAISKLSKYGYLEIVSFDGRKRNIKSRMINNESLPYKKSKSDNENLKDNNKNNNKDNKYIKEIVEYLNEKAGTHYRPTTDATIKVINARLNEKFTLDDFKTVIDKKVKQWKGTNMEEFLRPQTLFGNKFESYLNQTIIKQEKPVKTANFVPEPPKYREFEPEPQFETSQMPESMREKYRGFINEL